MTDPVLEELKRVMDDTHALVREISAHLPQDRPTIVIAMAFGFLFADSLQQFRHRSRVTSPELTAELVNAVMRTTIEHVFNDGPTERLQ